SNTSSITNNKKEIAKKLNVDANNLSNTGKINLTNTLGTGKIEDNNSNLVKGGVVKTYVDNKLNDKLSSSDVDVTGDEYITVTPNKNKYALSLNKDKLGANIDISNNNAITNINTEINKKANLDASNLKEQNIKDWQAKLGNGSVADNNTGLVNGGTVKAYVDGKITDNTNTINTKLDTKLNKDDLDVTGDDKYITVTNEDKTKKKYKVSFNEDNLKNLVNDTDITNNTYLKAKLDDKADKNASNLTETDVTSWQNKLGNGTITKDNAGLVKGDTVFTYVNNIKEELSTKATEDLNKKLDVDAKNISTDGVTNLTNTLGTGKIEDNDSNLVKGGVVKTYVDSKLNDKLSSSDVDVTGDEYITVTPNKNKYALSLNKDKLGANIDISNNNAITNINTEINKKANLDASNLKEQNIKDWQAKLGNGSVADNNTGLVNGGTVKAYVDGKITDNTNTINTKLDTKLNKDDLDVTGDDKYITVTNEDKTKKKYKVSFNEDNLKNLVNDTDITNNTYLKAKLDDKADKNASNLTETDVTSWQNKLGNGTITKDNAGLVKGDTVFTYVNNIKEELSTKATEDLNKKLDVDAKNISTDGVTNLTNTLGTGKIEDNDSNLVKGGVVKTYVDSKLNDKLSSSDVDVTGDEYITVTPNKNKYALSLNKDKLGANIDISNNNAITNINTEINKKANLDASNLKEQNIKDWQAKLGNGSVADNNTGLVNGGTVKAYVDGKITDNTNTINTKLDTKLNKDDLDVTGDDKYITVTNEDKTKKKYKVSFNEDNLKNLVNDTDITNNTYLKAKLDDKADKNASNLTETDVTSWQNKLGNGTITKDNAGLVKGGTVFTYVDNIANTIKQELSTKATGDLTKKLDVDAKNITPEGVTTLTNKLGTGEIKDNNNNLVTGGTVKKYITEEINTINNTVSGKLSSEDVDVKGDEYISVAKDNVKTNHYTLTFDKDKLATNLDLSKNTKLNEQFNKYALLDGTNLENIDLNVWQAKLGNGTIASGNTGLVKGGDIFNYVNNIKQELNNQTTQDLSNKLDKDGTNLDKDSLDKLTNKLSEESNLTTPTNRLVTDTKVSEALKGKLNADADNLSEKGITNLTTKLGKGEVKEGDTKLVTGGKVYSKLNEVKEELNKNISTNTQKITELDKKYTTLNNQVTTNTNDIKNLQTTVDGLKNTTQDITNINNKLGNIDKSITNINNKLNDKLDKADLSITGDNYIKVDKDTKFNYTLSLNKDTLANDLDLTNNSSINNMFTTKLGDINTNIGDLKTKVENNTNSINSLKTTVDDNTNKITNLTNKVDTNTKDIDTLKQDMTNKLSVDADNLTTKGETNLINKLSNGSDISKPNNRLVTDKQVNEHLSKNYYNKTEVDAKVSNISNTVVEANKKSDLALGGVANAVAMANLLQANSNAKYKTNISAAYGYYGGANALAVGFSGVSENRMVSYRVSGSVNTKGNIALGAGLGVMLGEFKTDKYPEKGKKISELEEKLKMQENEINILKKKAEKTDILEKQIQELMKLIKK
ncbi:YadA-like family protein, partial [Sneathia sanguinegens]|uniref:YadA-like family protein n=1 Tax=Sneathia sanguinegens TaxID=40543 RepID=UPI0023F97310